MNRRAGVIATIVAVVVMTALSLWAAPDLPDRVPTSFDFSGEVQGYGGRTQGLVLLPLMAAGLGAVLFVLPLVDPRRRHLAQSGKAYNAVWIATMVFLTGMHAAILLTATGRDVPIIALIVGGIGLLLIVMGNYLTKVRSNWFLGVRTPWTLSSERSWDRTHRLASRLFVGLGAIVLVAVLVSPQVAGWILIGGVVVVSVSTIAYSYVVWRDDPAREPLHHDVADR